MLACWCMAHSLGRRQNTFLPRLFARTIRTKGVVAQMVERPLCMRKVGGSMPSYSKLVFCLFSSDWFLYETRVAFPKASDDAGLRPMSQKITRFPVFSLLFWPLVSSPRPIRNRRSYRSVENPWRYASSPASNKRPSRKAATVAGESPLRAHPARRGLRSIRNSSSRHAFEHIARSDARP